MASIFALFGQVIRRMRIAAGFSQESLADAIGVHRNYIGTVERGETNITLENVLRLAKGLKQPIWVIFKEMEHAEAAPDVTAARLDSERLRLRTHRSATSDSQGAPARVAEHHAELRQQVVRALQELSKLEETTYQSPRAKHKRR
ncbi:MAG TPA: helix-turn-helix domain-containing protein [Pirellulales bacterium]|nr:helix-turn-helix domain-containing protein [Pirellulales bacterium]